MCILLILNRNDDYYEAPLLIRRIKYFKGYMFLAEHSGLLWSLDIFAHKDNEQLFEQSYFYDKQKGNENT